MNFRTLLQSENILITDTFPDVAAFYVHFSHFLKERGHIRDDKKVKRLFQKRENLHSTAIGKGAAAPHIYCPEFSEFLLCLAVIRHGLDFRAADGGPVYLVLLIMSDERDVGLHLKSLAHFARLVDTTEVVEAARAAETTGEIHRLMLGLEQHLL